LPGKISRGIPSDPEEAAGGEKMSAESRSDRPQLPPKAEEAYAEFLRRREQGEEVDFEAFCARRKDLADALRILHSFHRGPGGGGEASHGETIDLKDPNPAGRDAGSLGDSRRPPERIGPYHILGVLGEGGMGIVYAAEQKEPIQRRVALKVIKLGMNSSEVVARFEAERQALALMNHPGIARVYDAGMTTDGRPYFAMEHVPGIPLTSYCDRHKLGIKERLELFVQVCLAVEHAHHRGIIHRDLKPSNILVCTPDEAPVAKIIDFGVAKAVNQRLTEKTIYTELGRAVGTPAYMSPEQAELTGEDVDHRSDIYSLGVLLYELLTGELPLDWDSLSKVAFDEILRRIREEDPPTPSTRWSRLNIERTTRLATLRRTNPSTYKGALRGDLDWITMKTIEKDRERRYSTAARLAEDIGNYLKNEPVLATPPNAYYRLRKYARRHRTEVKAVGVVVLALLLGLLGTTWFALVAQRNARLANARAEENLVLADLQRLHLYRAEAERLQPTSLENILAMEGWIQKAGELASGLESHRSRLAAPREKGASTGQAEEERREHLQSLVEGLQEFLDQDPGKGTVAKVKDRFEGTPGSETFKDRWRKARASMGDRKECPLYGGRSIEIQPHLIPLGIDPDSGLWEFAHLGSGRLPDGAGVRDGSRIEKAAIVFVLLPGGRFRMGSPDPEEGRQPEEGPVHEVSLSPFFISKYEVTQAQWTKVMGGNPSKFSDEDWPVESVSAAAIEEFCQRTGLCLPTEAQWEFACRAGTSGPYAGTGNLDEMGWYLDNSKGHTQPIGRKKSNRYGLLDMHGNVWELCRDVWDPAFYGMPEASGQDPVATSGSDFRIRRGGSWRSFVDECRSATRSKHLPSDSSIFLGFRPIAPLRGE
jgi:serine/threonine protein kinase/formylglycine-generating enzyme required for sulfatase activity